MLFGIPESVLGDLRKIIGFLETGKAALSRTEVTQERIIETEALMQQTQARIEQKQEIQGEAIARLESTQAEQSAVLKEILQRVVGNNEAVAFRMAYTANPTP